MPDLIKPDEILFDRYRIIEQLGEGSMGALYKAEHTDLYRSVALRILPAALSQNPEFRDRFHRQFHEILALNHPSICSTYDVGWHNGLPYIATEYLEGKTLQHYLTRRLDQNTRRGIALDIADALDAAHSQGVIHRNINPSNIFLTDHGAVKILNFGLATIIGEPADSSLDTIAYLSPEQIRGEAPDARSDLFSLGAVLYQIATNQLPFPGDTPATVSESILNQTPASPFQFNSGITSRFARIIFKALQKDPSLRYQQASEMRIDLQRSNDHDESEPCPH
jgi:eukaryotic-like serine/threonine-protein kinase